MIRNPARPLLNFLALPRSCRRVMYQDWRGIDRVPDPGLKRAVFAMVRWLCRAQDRSTSLDGGIARHFSLTGGWAPSYPETTGYIVPTLLCADRDNDLKPRARRSLDWLVSIQLANGAFQGGPVGAKPVLGVAFNTGQVLLGLAAGERAFGGYEEPLARAAMFLRDAQDSDGCWRRYPSPFARSGSKAYDAHAAWGLLEADSMLPGHGFSEAALRNMDWVLSRQRDNGWFDDCCLTDHTQPLTHTIGYALRGLIEAYRFSNEGRYRKAALKAGLALIQTQRPDGALPGRLDANWASRVAWSCLTGNAQIAVCWFQLYEQTGDCRFLKAAETANAFLRRSLLLEGDLDITGGVKGSYPVHGGYCRFEYLSWAAKFAIDANILERNLKQSSNEKLTS